MKKIHQVAGLEGLNHDSEGSSQEPKGVTNSFAVNAGKNIARISGLHSLDEEPEVIQYSINSALDSNDFTRFNEITNGEPGRSMEQKKALFDELRSRRKITRGEVLMLLRTDQGLRDEVFHDADLKKEFSSYLDGTDDKAVTPIEGTKLSEEMSLGEFIEATVEDVPEIMAVYEPLIFDRQWFVDLGHRKEHSTAEILEILRGLSGGGELSPISPEEWERRVREERVLIMRSPPDEQHPKGKITTVHSYILPDNDKNRAKIKQRIDDINERDGGARTWFGEIERNGVDNVLMTEDVFVAKNIRHKGIHAIIYLKTLLHELQKTGISYKWIYYWINFFIDAFIESQQQISLREEGEMLVEEKGRLDGEPVTHQKRLMEIDQRLEQIEFTQRGILQNRIAEFFNHPPFNRAMLMATIKAGGGIVGKTHNPEKNPSGYVLLPDGKEKNKPYTTKSGEHIALIRPYVDVKMDAEEFYK